MKIDLLKPVIKFIDKVDTRSQARIARHLSLLSQFNYKLGLPFCKKLASNLYELRILGETNIRIFYTFQNNQIYLLHAFVKKTDQIPKKHFTLAKARLKSLTSV
jgi:phage-related protein